MENSGISLTEISTIVTAVSTVIYTVGTFMLWSTSNKTADLIRQQISNQVASNNSIAHHATLDAHRDLFINIIKDKDLLNIYAADFCSSADDARHKLLASLLINHTLRIFEDICQYSLVDSRGSFDSFVEDARELFTLSFVRDRWMEVKEFHPPKFRAYVESNIL